MSLQRTDLDICPVKAVLEFMAARAAGPGPFFMDQNNGMGLTRWDFVAEVRKALAEKGMPDIGISGHSFRTLNLSILDSFIRTLIHLGLDASSSWTSSQDR